MKLIVGLGNIGLNYQNTRHNVGFMVIDKYAGNHNLVFTEEKKFKCYMAAKNYNGEKVLFIKPTTYMNLSGDAVRLVMDYYKISIADVLIIYDDLDSNVGRIRLRDEGSSGGHNGIKSIINNTNTTMFKRVKIGIGRNPNMSAADYVLGKFSADDLNIINNSVDVSCDIIDEFANDVPFYKIASKYSKK